MEARKFLESARGDRLRALYSVALTIGLRQGEALGLRWQDVDLDVGVLTVSKQLQRIEGEFRLVEPKTRRSRRTLRQENERVGPARSDWNLVFSRADGQPLDGTVVTHQFHRLLSNAGLPQRRFHDLRQSCATML